MMALGGLSSRLRADEAAGRKVDASGTRKAVVDAWNTIARRWKLRGMSVSATESVTHRVPAT